MTSKVHAMQPDNNATPRPPGYLVIPQVAFALAHSKGDQYEAHEFASANWWTESAKILKSAITSGTTSDQNWAAELTDYRRWSGAFIERMRARTILGRLLMRPVEPNTRTLVALEGVNAGWVGEGIATPISDLSLDELLLPVSKAQTSIVVTSEMVRFATPGAVAALEAAMVKALASTLDTLFIDPTVSATADGPASVTNGVVALSSSGTSAAQITTDIKAMAQKLIDAGSDLTAAVWVMHPRSALYLSLLLNAGNQRAFPEVTALGGTLAGLPVITSASVPVDTGSDSYLALIDASRILSADDGLVAVDVSRQSSIQLRTDPQTGAQALVSLWQANLVGIRLTRWLSWKVVDTGAIAALDDVAW